MSSGRWPLKYSGAAIITAIIIIAVALSANPILPQQNTLTSFQVMLTDPPTVPAGTTQLNLTYTDVSLHITYTNGTAEWLSVGASGTVNLFSLVNMTVTIASVTIPLNSTVDGVQFTIDNVTAVVNGNTYNVTALSNTFVVNVLNGEVNQTLSGVLVDFNPTLVQIQAFDANGATVYYYVLVPSAKAIIVNDLSEDNTRVGTIVKLSENNKVKLVYVEQEFSSNVTITSASLSVNGNTTSLSVTLKNNGSANFTVFGLTLKGEFNTTKTFIKNQNQMEQVSDRAIPFKLNGSSLIPLFGTSPKDNDNWNHSSLTLQPGDIVTLSFSGVIGLHLGNDNGNSPIMVITPIVDDSFTLRLMGEGFQTFTFNATS